MGNAAGQMSDCLHFLGLAQFFLNFQFADIGVKYDAAAVAQAVPADQQMTAAHTQLKLTVAELIFTE